MIYHIRDEHINHDTINAVRFKMKLAIMCDYMIEKC
jgi:hypothetical protein